MAGRKALAINLDAEKYGTFAEIGAGQEVARWFFQVGGAAGTVAKSMSAYDMAFSDAIYGACGRYVCEQRLEEMLDHEYRLLVQRLAGQRGGRTSFFVFADTVAARSHRHPADGHGWMGVRFQTAPGALPSDVRMHVRLWDAGNTAQQHALGLAGVNLLHGALFHWNDPERLLAGLGEGIAAGRIEIDLIRFAGPAFEGRDKRWLHFGLVRAKLARAVVVDAAGAPREPSDILYKKPVLVLRGRYAPVTLAHLDILKCARARFAEAPEVGGAAPAVLMEIPVSRMEPDAHGGIAREDLLARLDTLQALGCDVMLSDFDEYFRLSAWFNRFKRGMLGFAMGIMELKGLFEHGAYEQLEGGLLEGFGRLLKSSVKIYVYPARTRDGVLVTAENFRTPPGFQRFYGHLLESGGIEALEGWDESVMRFRGDEAQALLQAGDPAWEAMTPAAVVERIRGRGLFGWNRGAGSGEMGAR